MPIRILHIALTLISMLMMLSCKENKNEPAGDDRASRTVLVYMAASNTLGSGSVKYDYRDLDEMIAAAEN